MAVIALVFSSPRCASVNRAFAASALSAGKAFNPLRLACVWRAVLPDGDKIVPPWPQRLDPGFETAPGKDQTGAIDQRAQPPLTRDAMMEGRELSQQALMMLAPDTAIASKPSQSSHGRWWRGSEEEALRPRDTPPPWFTHAARLEKYFKSKANRARGTPSFAPKPVVSLILAPRSNQSAE
ncbi:MAG: hypothetical protein M3Z96_02865 [Pseudomonadota bacterium]|nr:hypothetical protein [Pseudomonadota bacterium]